MTMDDLSLSVRKFVVTRLAFFPKRLLLSISVVMAGCASPGFFGEDLPDEVRRLCGRQCLLNGAECSQFFARKNEERRQAFEQAKSNYWLCLKRFEGQTVPGEVACVPPGVPTEAFDHCGQDLDACFDGCGITLDELTATTQKEPNNPGPREADTEGSGN